MRLLVNGSACADHAIETLENEADCYCLKFRTMKVCNAPQRPAKVPYMPFMFPVAAVCNISLCSVEEKPRATLHHLVSRTAVPPELPPSREISATKESAQVST